MLIFCLPKLVESMQDHDCKWEKNHHAWVEALMGFSWPKTVKIWLKFTNFDVFLLLPPVTHCTWQS